MENIEDTLNFYNLKLSNNEKKRIQRLYKRSMVRRLEGDHQELLQLPCLDIPDSFTSVIGNDTVIKLTTEDRSVFYALLTLSALALGSRSVVESRMAESNNEYIILKGYRTKINIDIDGVINYIQDLSGKARNPKTRSNLKKRFLYSLKNGLKNLSEQRYLDGVPVVEVLHGDLEKGKCTLVFRTKFINQVYAVLVDEIIEKADKTAQITSVVNLVSVYYGFCTEMINEKGDATSKKDTTLTELDLLNIEHKSNLTPSRNKVIVDPFGKKIKKYKLSVRVMKRQGAWRKQKVIADRIGIEYDVMKKYVKQLRKMDIIRSVILYSPAGRNSLAVDMTRYNSDFALRDFFSKRSTRYSNYTSVKSLWWEGEEVISKKFVDNSEEQSYEQMIINMI